MLPADLLTRLACHQPGSGGCGRKKPALFSSNLSSLCSRGKKPVCWSGAGLGPGPGCRVKRDRTQVDVRVLLGSVGRRQFLAGPGRRDQPRLGAALLQDTYHHHHHHTAGKVTLRAETKRSWSVVCCVLSFILLPECRGCRDSAASPWKYDPYLSCLAAAWRILVQARAQHCKLFRLTEIGMHTSKEMAECAPSK